MNKFTSGDYVTSPRFKGIALIVIGNSQIDMYDVSSYCDHGPSYYESYCPYCNGEIEIEAIPIICEDEYDCVMVGDDEVHRIYEDELFLLSRDGFCSECGQIGCNHSIVE
jgi:hypothetical protein